MSNRFAGRIRSGRIDTIEALKSEFKGLAKRTHPDLLGPGAAGGDFAALRSEYEDALRDFICLRYGSPASDSGAVLVFDRRALYADLARLFARGFPKAARHEKEKARYERCRYLVRSRLRAWDPSYPGLFDEFESAMLGLKAAGGSDAFDEALALVAAALEYQASGVEHARTVAELDFARFRAARGQAPRGSSEPAEEEPGLEALKGFLSLLIGDMAGGPASA